MSYSVYQYPSSGSSYDAFSQQYDSQSYNDVDQQAQTPQYGYTSTPSQGLYTQSAAPLPTDYGGYNSTSDTGYTSAPVTSYSDSSSSHPLYHYNQDSDQFLLHSSDIVPVSLSAPASHYLSGTTTQDQATSQQTVSGYSPYQYQTTDYNQPSSSFGHDNTSSGYTGPYSQKSSSFSYHDEPSQSSSTWTTNDQYNSYNPVYFEESASGASYRQKVELEYGNTDYPSLVDRFHQNSSVDTAGGGYSQSDKYLVKQSSSYQGYVAPVASQDYAKPVASQSYVKPVTSQDYVKSYTNQGYAKPIASQDYVKPVASQGYAKPMANRSSMKPITSRIYVKPVTSHVTKPQYDFAAYNTPEPLNKFENKNIGGSKSHSSEREVISVATIPSSGYSSDTERQPQGHSDFQGEFRDSFVNRGSRNSFAGELKITYPTNHTSTIQRSFNHGVRNFSARGAFSARGTFVSSNRGNRRTNSSKPPLIAFDARNKINESRSQSSAQNKLTRNFPLSNKRKVPVSTFKSPESIKKEVFKAPSRPQDRLLNEIEEREKAQRAEDLKKSEEVRNQAEEKRLKDLEEVKKKAEEELRRKAEDEALKAAPPSKTPETAEEIAHEEEIQRKIRQSLVIIKPEHEIALMKDDPSKDFDMPEELRTLLKSQTTDYLCKLCSVRIVGPQMAAMHYNGKNHMRKLRNFVQSNGRSAGFNLDTLDKPAEGEQKTENAEEKKTEIVEITHVDEKKYCKVCKMFFSQDSQADMHYKGKVHAKKIKSVGTGNGPEVFECRICSVSVTAQEHLTAHLNGARHKQQVRKLDTNENYRGAMRGRGRIFGFRGRERGGRGIGRGGGGEMRSLPNVGNRGRGFGGRGNAGSDFVWRGAGLKRRGGFNDGQPYHDGPTFFKRPRF